MKGVIFNLLEASVTRHHGEDVWDQLVADAGVDGVYTSLKSYPDSDLGALVGAAAVRLSMPPQEVISWFGEAAVPFLAERFPGFFAGHSDTLAFLLTLNDVIHAEVRKIYPDAFVPEFGFERPGDDQLVIGYASPRKLCALAEGLIRGSASHFGQSVEIHQTRCMLREDPECRILCVFHAA